MIDIAGMKHGEFYWVRFNAAPAQSGEDFEWEIAQVEVYDRGVYVREFGRERQEGAFNIGLYEIGPRIDPPTERRPKRMNPAARLIRRS